MPGLALLHLLKTEQSLQFRKGNDDVIRLQLYQMLTGKRGRNRNDPDNLLLFQNERRSLNPQ